MDGVHHQAAFTFNNSGFAKAKSEDEQQMCRRAAGSDWPPKKDTGRLPFPIRRTTA